MDDGLGPAVYALLGQSPLPEGVRLQIGGILGLSLLDDLDGADRLVIVDAFCTKDGVPGQLRQLTLDDIPDPRPALSCHRIGLVELLAVCRLLYPERMPGQLVLLGIEAKDLSTFAMELSPEVKASLPELMEVLRAEIAGAR